MKTEFTEQESFALEFLKFVGKKKKNTVLH